MKEFLNQGPFSAVVQTIICLSVFAVFLAVFLDFALYSRKDAVQTEKKSVVETGTMTLFFLAFYAIIRSGAGGVAIFSDTAKISLIVIGTAMIAAGAAANIGGRLSLGKNWSNQIKIYREQTFVRTGVYAVVRHPLYASIILMFYGACLVYRNIIALLAVMVVFVPFMRYRARQEEKILTERFPEYEDYRKRTGLFFPKLRDRRSHD